MRPLRVNFASPRRVHPALGYALALGLLVLALLELRWGLGALVRAEALEAQVRQAEQAADQRVRSAQALVAPRPEPPYLRDALAIAQSAEFDVGRVLAALEAVRVEGVRVRAIELVTSEKLARVDLELSVVDALPQYLDEINAGLDPAQHWRLLRVQSPNGQTPGLAVIQADPAIGKR